MPMLSEGGAMPEMAGKQINYGCLFCRVGCERRVAEDLMENKRTETNKTVQKRLEPELKLINMDIFKFILISP